MTTLSNVLSETAYNQIDIQKIIDLVQTSSFDNAQVVLGSKVEAIVFEQAAEAGLDLLDEDTFNGVEIQVAKAFDWVRNDLLHEYS